MNRMRYGWIEAGWRTINIGIRVGFAFFCIKKICVHKTLTHEYIFTSKAREREEEGPSSSIVNMEFVNDIWLIDKDLAVIVLFVVLVWSWAFHRPLPFSFSAWWSLHRANVWIMLWWAVQRCGQWASWGAALWVVACGLCRAKMKRQKTWRAARVS